MPKMTSCQSSNNCQTSNTISKTSPLITLPFPPVISASDIVNKRKPCKVKSKSPNAFLIYRKAFLDQLSIKKHNLRMTDVSKLVSNHWKCEPESVKDEYRKIAREVEVELNERRKKSVTYRVVWKNSKYSARKRTQVGKVTKTQGNKSEVNARFKAATVSSNRGNVFYQFVPAYPELEFSSRSSKSSKKNNKKVDCSTSNSETLCSSPENSQNSQETNDNLECLPIQPYFLDENLDWYLQNLLFYN